MFGAALDTAIGLVTIFLMLSLICSALNEMVASITNRRGAFLRRGVATLFGEPLDRRRQPNTTKFFEERRISALCSEQGRVERIVQGVARSSGPDDARLPSYIPPATFGAVAADLTARSAGMSTGGRVARIAAAAGLSRPATAAPAANGAPGTGAAAASGNGHGPPWTDGTCSRPTDEMVALLRDAVQRAAESPPRLLDEEPAVALRRIEDSLGRSFTETMDRVSGWYRRRTQCWLFSFAILVVILVNADALVIIRHLAVDEHTRTALAELGVAQAGTPAGDTSTWSAEQYANRAKEILDGTRGVVLPLGWELDHGGWKDLVGAGAWCSKALGLLLTAVAVALGAPFWFDVLQKLASLRSAGSKPATDASAGATGDTSRDGGGSTARGGDGGAGARGAGGGVGALVPSAGASMAPGASSPPAPTASNAATMPALPPGYWSSLVASGPWTALSEKDPTVPLRLAQLSAIAYRPEAVAREMLADLGIDEIEWLDGNGTQAFVGTLGKDVVIAFRGTQPSEVQDLVADAQFALREYPPRSGSARRVHCGFAAALDAVLKDLDGALKKSRRDGGLVWLTGHSLGAALASLAFGRLVLTGSAAAPSLRLVNFACPRVGDERFRTDVEAARGRATADCITLERDPVPLVPPMSMGYRHIGTVRTLSIGGVESTGESWRALLDTLIDASTDLRRAATESLRRHGIEVYIAALEAAAEARRP